MVKINTVLCALLIFHFYLHGNIQFIADSLTLELPSRIIASGNTLFKRQDMNISSQFFTYDTSSQTALFESNVIIRYKNSVLRGKRFELDVNKQLIKGSGTIVFKAENIKAFSERLIITNYELLRLKNNVRIKQNGSQIKSNELLYNLKTDTILSNERVRLILEE